MPSVPAFHRTDFTNPTSDDAYLQAMEPKLREALHAQAQSDLLTMIDAAATAQHAAATANHKGIEPMDTALSNGRHQAHAIVASANDNAQPPLSKDGLHAHDGHVIPFVDGRQVTVPVSQVGELSSFVADPSVLSFQDGNGDLVIIHAHDGVRDTIRVQGYFQAYPSQAGELPPLSQADQVIEASAQNATLHGDVSQDQLTTQATDPTAGSTDAAAPTLDSLALTTTDTGTSSFGSPSFGSAVAPVAPASAPSFGGGGPSTPTATPAPMIAAATLAPSTLAPSTLAPTTLAPSTVAPISTVPPATQAPITTQPPVTTEAPISTQPPVTQAADPGTQAPVTLTPTTVPPTTITGNTPTLQGGTGNDIIVGTGTQSITGGTGTETIAGGGSDTITAGSGNDSITTNGHSQVTLGGGQDTLTSAGHDTITGGVGPATIQGGTSDSITGGSGSLEISLGGGANTLVGGAGDETITSTTGADKITLGGGHNSLVGGSGTLSVTGTTGFDTIVAGSGNETIDEGANSNGASIAAGSGHDTIIGSSGADTIRLDDQGFALITTNAGSDRIYVGMSISGHDTITDFDPLRDQFVLTDAGGAPLAGAALQSAATAAIANETLSGSDLSVSIGGATLLLQNEAGALSYRDFGLDDVSLTPNKPTYATGIDGNISITVQRSGNLLAETSDLVLTGTAVTNGEVAGTTIHENWAQGEQTKIETVALGSQVLTGTDTLHVAEANLSEGGPMGPLDLNIVDGHSLVGVTAQASVNEGGTINGTFTLQAPKLANEVITFDLIDQHGVTTHNHTATITAGQTTVGWSVATSDDNIYQGPGAQEGTVQAVITGLSGNATLGGVGSGVAVPVLNIDPAPSLAVGPVTTNEGTTENFTVTVNGATTLPVVIDYTTQNGTAIAGTNFTATSGEITIPAGQSTGIIAVPTIHDNQVTSNLDYTLKLTSVSGATAGVTTIDGTIANIDLPSLTIGNVTTSEGQNVVMTATLSQAVNTPVSFDWTAAFDGTAASSRVDASNASPVTITIPAGQTATTFTVGGAAHDGVYEGGPGVTENMHVQISNITGPISNAGGNMTATVNLADIDAPPTITISAPTVIRGQDEVFTITRTGQTDRSVTGAFATADGTGVAGVDYTATSGTFTIPAGGQSNTTTVTVHTPAGGSTNNVTDLLKLTSISGAAVTSLTGQDTIFGNQVHITNATVNGANLVFTVETAQPVPVDTVLNWNRTDVNGAASIIGGGFGGQVTIHGGQNSATITLPISASPGLGGPGVTKLTLSGGGGTISILGQPAYGMVDGGSQSSHFTAAEINSGSFQPGNGFDAETGNQVGPTGTEYFVDNRGTVWFGPGLDSANPNMTKLLAGDFSDNAIIPLGNGNIAVPLSTGYGVYQIQGNTLVGLVANQGFMTGFPSIGALADGSGFVVAYSTNTGGSASVHYSIVNDDGSVRTPFTQIPITGVSNLSLNDVTPAPNGGLTIWGQALGGAALGEWAIPLDSTGTPAAPVLLTGTAGGPNGGEFIQTETGFAEVYRQNNGPNQFSSQEGVNLTGYNTMLQLWDPHGNALGAAVNITNIASISLSTDQVAIGATPGGGFAIAWSTFNSDTIMSETLNIAFYNAQGQQIGSTQQPLGGGTSNGAAEITDLSIRTLPNGQVLMTAAWSGEGAGSSNSEFYNFVYNSDGTFAHEFNSANPFTGDGSITGAHGTVVTGDANDTVAGTGNQAIFLGAGNDSVVTSTATSEVFGGAGNDTIDASHGVNKIWAGTGAESITAGGQTTIVASTGSLTIAGTAGTVLDFSQEHSALDIDLKNSTIAGLAAAASISGVQNIVGTNLGDTIIAGPGNELITAGSGNNSIVGGSGADIIQTGGGNNTIDQGGGAANIITGAGNDVVTIENINFGMINGGSGTNTLKVNVGGTVDLTTLTNQVLHMQVVDLTGTADQTLHLNAENISLGLQRVIATSDDMVVLRGGAWTQGSTVVQSGITFNTYSQGGESVLIDARAQVTQQFDNVAPLGFHDQAASFNAIGSTSATASLTGDAAEAASSSVSSLSPLLAGGIWQMKNGTIGYSLWNGETDAATSANANPQVIAAIHQAFDAWGKALGITFVDETSHVANQTMSNNGSDIAFDLSGGLLNTFLGKDAQQYLGVSFGTDVAENNNLLAAAGTDRAHFQTIEGDIGLAANIADAGLQPGQPGYYAILQEIGHALGVGQVSPDVLAQVMNQTGADPQTLAQTSTAVEGVPLAGDHLAAAPGAAEVAALSAAYHTAGTTSDPLVQTQQVQLGPNNVVTVALFDHGQPLAVTAENAPIIAALNTAIADIDAHTGLKIMTISGSGSDLEHSSAAINLDLDPSLMNTLLGATAGQVLSVTLSQDAAADRQILTAAGADGANWIHPEGTIILDPSLLTGNLGEGQQGLNALYQALEHSLGVTQLPEDELSTLLGRNAADSTLSNGPEANGQWATGLSAFDAAEIRAMFHLPDPHPSIETATLPADSGSSSDLGTLAPVAGINDPSTADHAPANTTVADTSAAAAAPADTTAPIDMTGNGHLPPEMSAMLHNIESALTQIEHVAHLTTATADDQTHTAAQPDGTTIEASLAHSIVQTIADTAPTMAVDNGSSTQIATHDAAPAPIDVSQHAAPSLASNFLAGISTVHQATPLHEEAHTNAPPPAAIPPEEPHQPHPHH